MHKIVFILLLLAGVILPGSAGWGQEPAAQFEQANEAYKSGDYDRAVDTYEQLRTQGMVSEALLYNLGNAYYRQGKMGKAILNYEKALLLDPGDGDIRHNLEVARSFLPEGLEAVPEFFLIRWWRIAHQSAGSGVWSVLGLCLLWLGVGGLVVWLLAPQRHLRKKGFFWGWGLLLLSILPFSLAAGQASYEKNSGFAVVVGTETALRSGADAQSAPLVTLPPGVKLKLLDVIGDWHKVRLENGEEGWVRKDVFETI